MDRSIGCRENNSRVGSAVGFYRGPMLCPYMVILRPYMVILRPYMVILRPYMVILRPYMVISYRYRGRDLSLRSWFFQRLSNLEQGGRSHEAPVDTERGSLALYFTMARVSNGLFPTGFPWSDSKRVFIVFPLKDPHPHS